ncbi:MAG: universal stress protein [Bacteroidota bacterium]
METLKHILVPTDFSLNSNNAVRYAIKMAEKCKAKITLLHTYRLISGKHEKDKDNGVTLKKELEHVAISKFHHIEELMLKNTSVQYEFLLEVGFLSDRLGAYTEAEEVNMVIAAHDRSNGSIGTFKSDFDFIIDSLKCPVLLIPEGLNFGNIEKIVFVCDCSDISNLEVMDTLLAITRMYEAEIDILLINKNDPLTNKNMSSLSGYLGEVPHSFHVREDDNIEDGVANYLSSEHPDLMALLNRGLNLDELYAGKKASASEIPLLAFKD